MASFKYLFHDPVDKEKKYDFSIFLNNNRGKEPQREVSIGLLWSNAHSLDNDCV